VRFPKISDTVLRADHEGSPEQALVMVVWPTFVSTEARRREMRALNLASDIFEERLRDRLREGLGKSYAPSVTSQFPNRFDQGSVKAVMETTPADASAMAQEAFAAARLIAQGQFTAADLERVRKPLLDGAAKRRESHGFWLNLLDGSWRDPSALVAERSWERDYRTLSLSEVRIAAARWLGPDQALVVVSAPKAVKTEVAVTATAADKTP